MIHMMDQVQLQHLKGDLNLQQQQQQLQHCQGHQPVQQQLQLQSSLKKTNLPDLKCRLREQHPAALKEMKKRKRSLTSFQCWLRGGHPVLLLLPGLQRRLRGRHLVILILPGLKCQLRGEQVTLLIPFKLQNIEQKGHQICLGPTMLS